MKKLTLFDDQAELFEDIRAGMKRYKSNLIVSPTGSGKTAIATKMLQAASEKNKRVLFSVPRRTLMDQTSNTFEGYGISHSFVSSGKQFNPYAKSYIGTVDSMARRLDKLPEIDLLIIDETHFGAGSLDAVIKHYKRRNTWILGLSASPWKLNGKGLGCWYDNMIEGKSVKWLIENNRLSNYKYFCGKTKPDLSSLKVAGGDYVQNQMQDFMEHQGAIIGDCVADYQKRCMGKIHIVRCASIKHSMMVAESFRDAGIAAVHVDGKSTTSELRQIFRAFALRQISGIDVCIESQSDLKPSKSLAGQLQYWGRALRYKPEAAIIMDHVNNYVEHGFPDDERQWTLEDRIQNKAASDERAIPTRLCVECHFTHRPAPCCPECGYVYPIKYREVDEIDGELVEIDSAARQNRKPIDPVKMKEAIQTMTENGIKKGMPREKAIMWAAKKYTKQMAAR